MARPREAIVHEQRLIELHRVEGRSIAWALAECAVCRVFGVDLDGAMGDATEAVRLGEQEGDALAVVLGLSVLAFARTASGASAEAVKLADRAVALADTTPHGEGHLVHPNLFRGIALQSAGRHADATRALARGRTLGEALGAAWALPVYHFLAALGHWDRGEWDNLLTEITAGMEHGEEPAFSIGQAWAYGVAGRVHLHRGELDRAATVLGQADDMVAERGAQVGMDWIVLTRALLLEGEGRRAEGLDLLRLAWEAAAGVQASSSLVLIGGDSPPWPWSAVRRRSPGTWPPSWPRWSSARRRISSCGAGRRALGLVNRDRGALSEALEAFDRLGHRFEAAVVRAELAERLLAEGRVTEATAALDLSLADLDAIGAAHEAIVSAPGWPGSGRAAGPLPLAGR